MKQQELHYTAIGDSLTAGYGVPSEYSFPARYRALAEQATRKKVVLHNTGKVGATAGEILLFIKQDADVRSYVQQADIITVTAGGNDLIQAAKTFYYDRDSNVLMTALVQYAKHMRQLIRELKRMKQNKSRPCMIRLIGIYNPLPEFSESVFWIKRFNAQLYRLENDSIRVVDVYDAFMASEAELLSDDRFHPNAEGYQLIAEMTHKQGYGRLGQRSSR
jgi:lysophospholipase L1-like esterase